MAETVGKSLLIGKLGATFVKAHEENKANAYKGDTSGELPAPMEGVARLADCRIIEIAKGKKNEGKLMFYAAGIVVLPKEVNGVPVRGRRTQITIPIYDTPTRSEGNRTVSDHIKKIYDILQGLGLKTALCKPDTIELAMLELKKSKPHFYFRTWKGEKQTSGPYAGREPLVNHVWGEKCEAPKLDVATMAVLDKLPEVEPPTHNPDDEPTNVVTSAVNTEPSTNGHSDPVNLDSIDGGDLDSLVNRSNAGDIEAAQMLMDQCRALGASEKFVTETLQWSELADYIRSGGKTPETNTGKSEETKNPEEISYEIGQHWLFKPMDPRTKKPMVNPVTVEIINFPEDPALVDLKNVKFPTVLYKNVPIADLISVS